MDFYRKRAKSAVFRFCANILKPLNMVKSTLMGRRFRRLGWMSALLLLSTMADGTENPAVELAAGLSVLQPESMAVSAYRGNDRDEFPVLVGDLDGEPAYFLAAVRVRHWERSNVLWTKLERELRDIDPSDNLSVIARGGFATGAGSEVRYRGYRFRHKDGFRRQVYFLLRSDTQIYWLTLTAVEDAELDVVIPLAQALIRRTRLADEVRQ